MNELSNKELYEMYLELKNYLEYLQKIIETLETIE